MTRSKLLLAWSALLLGLSACDKTTDSTSKDTKPGALAASLSSTELTAGGSAVDLSVTASSDTGIVSILPSFKDASGAPVTGSFVPQVTGAPKVGDKTFASSGWKLSALSTAKAGSYVLVLTLVEKSGMSSTKELAFTVKTTSVVDPVDPVDPNPSMSGMIRDGNLAVGAQSSIYPSFMELSGADASQAWSSGAGIPYRTIDVVFGADGSTASFMSPDYASSGAFNLSSWSTTNTTVIVDLGTTKPSSAAAISNQLISKGRSSVAVVNGRYYGVGTESGDLVLLYVTSLTGSGRSAEAKVDVYLEDGRSVVDPVDPSPTDWPKVTLGAQSATPPSALDVDGKTAYSSGAKTDAEIAEIDLLFYNEGGVLRFIAPSYAKTNGVSLVSGWSQTNATYFYDNGTAPVTSLAQAVALLSGETTSDNIPVVAGHYYIVEQADGLICAVKVESVTGSGSTAVVSVSMTTLGNSPFGGE